MRLRCQFRAANRGCISNFDLHDEAVPAPRNGFHKAGTLRGVAEGLADFVDRFVEPVVEIHEGIGGPELLLQFLSRYYLAGVIDQHGQHLKRLLLDFDLQSMFSEFTGTEINLEDAKAKTPGKLMAFWHEEQT
jgi:hypothetical protein